MAAQRDPLLQLPEFIRIEFLIEFRLAREHDLQQLLPRRFQIGQKPDFFQYFRRKVVRLVHHQGRRQPF